jgi:hypothetical protein
MCFAKRKTHTANNGTFLDKKINQNGVLLTAGKMHTANLKFLHRLTKGHLLYRQAFARWEPALD